MTNTNTRFAAALQSSARHVRALAVVTSVLIFGGFNQTIALHAQTAPTLKVLDWNIHHGLDTSNVNNLDRVVTAIVAANPQVVSLNEVEKQNGYNGNADEPAVLEAALEARTGAAWYGCFAQREGEATGQGNLILSRIRIESCAGRQLSASRSAARATISVNNVDVAVFSTHLDESSASTRATQIAELTAWAMTMPGERILMGDFNASASELDELPGSWEDAWAVASARGTAIAYASNTAGNTRNGRIDYIWRKLGGTSLVLQSAQVYDTGTISDHRPVSATYTVAAALTGPRAPAGLRVVMVR